MKVSKVFILYSNLANDFKEINLNVFTINSSELEVKHLEFTQFFSVIKLKNQREYRIDIFPLKLLYFHLQVDRI